MKDGSGGVGWGRGDGEAVVKAQALTPAVLPAAWSMTLVMKLRMM